MKGCAATGTSPCGFPGPRADERTSSATRTSCRMPPTKRAGLDWTGALIPTPSRPVVRAGPRDRRPRTPRLTHRDRRRARPAHQGGHRPGPNARGSTGPAGLREKTARELTGTAGSNAVICCGSAVVGDDRLDWNVYSQLGHRFPACARRPDLTGCRSLTIASPLVRATLRARQDSNPRPAA